MSNQPSRSVRRERQAVAATRGRPRPHSRLNRCGRYEPCNNPMREGGELNVTLLKRLSLSKLTFVCERVGQSGTVRVIKSRAHSPPPPHRDQIPRPVKRNTPKAQLKPPDAPCRRRSPRRVPERHRRRRRGGAQQRPPQPLLLAHVRKPHPEDQRKRVRVLHRGP